MKLRLRLVLISGHIIAVDVGSSTDPGVCGGRCASAVCSATCSAATTGVDSASSASSTGRRLAKELAENTLFQLVSFTGQASTSSSSCSGSSIEIASTTTAAAVTPITMTVTFTSIIKIRTTAGTTKASITCATMHLHAWQSDFRQWSCLD